MNVERIWEAGGRQERIYDAAIKGEWRVSDLRTAVENEPEFDLYLNQFDFQSHHFECTDLVEFASHMKHVQEADLSYPVILNEKGAMLDGRHRMVKALLEGKESVKAKRVPKGTPATIPNPP